ncbi:YoaK family protein [Helcococcus ovis]|uniref:YoaK family protein n=1 Tax=Helcococcus TaxID=31983 RepID=UPI0038BB1724
MKKEQTTLEREIISKSHTKFKLWIYWITLLSGIMNVYAIKTFGATVTHHTGNGSWIALSNFQGNIPVYRFIVLIVFFFLGATISGIIFHRKIKLAKKRYAWILISGGIVLIFLQYINIGFRALYLITFWMGLQNGLFISYKGVTVRTSHITGYITDAGFSFGQYIKGNKRQLRYMLFYIKSICAFILGGFLGYYITEFLEYEYIIFGLLYILCGAFFLYLRNVEINE